MARRKRLREGCCFLHPTWPVSRIFPVVGTSAFDFTYLDSNEGTPSRALQTVSDSSDMRFIKRYKLTQCTDGPKQAGASSRGSGHHGGRPTMFQLTYCAIDRLSSIRLWRSKERKVHSAGDRSTIDSIDHDVRCLLPLDHGTGAADGEGGHFGKDSTAGDYVRPPECAGFEQPSLGADRVTVQVRSGVWKWSPAAVGNHLRSPGRREDRSHGWFSGPA